MKVLIATGLYPPEIGGPATYARMLEEVLPTKGIEIKIVPFGWVRRYPKIIRHIAFAWKVWREAKGYDIIYALDPISVGVPASLVAKLTKKKFLLRLGGDYAWEQGRVRFGIEHTLDDYLITKNNAPIPVKVLAWLQKKVAEAADRVIVPSQYLKSIVERWGIQESKIVVIHSALFPLNASGTKEALRSQLSYTGPTIVSAGRLVPWKGFSVLLNAVNDLRKSYADISLIIVGDGAERATLESQVKKMSLENHVRFAGRVSKDTLAAIIKAGDIFVLNTAYEGLSHQLLEVMDLGIPIVTTTAGGNTELIEDEVTGLLVEFNDQAAIVEAIQRLFSHPETGERLVQSARARSKDFSQSTVTEEVVALLHEIHHGRKT